MKLVWRRQAESDLNEIFESILRQNPSAAWRIYEAIRSKVERLKEQPSLGRPGRVAGTRELVITGTPYLVPYTVFQPLDAVVVLRVLHGAREWPEEF